MTPRTRLVRGKQSGDIPFITSEVVAGPKC